MTIRTRGLGFVGALAVVGWSSVASAAPAPKVDICHRHGNGTSSIINISANAAPAHLRHGDSTPAHYWSDADGDGFGNPAGTHNVCPQPGLVANATDCNDASAVVGPGAVEVAYNGIDDDCNPATADDDLDHDGFGHGEDCDETRADINPGMDEAEYNGIDDDCDPATPDDDLDFDGFGLDDDCDDGDPATHPGAADACGDALDNDCDGVADEDCQVSCPCFGPEDIQTAYELYQAAQADNASTYAACFDESFTGAYELTTLYFKMEAFNNPLYESDFTKFYTYGYDDYYHSNYCQTFEEGFVYNYAAGTYDESTSSGHFQYVSAAERDECGAVILDWAAGAGLSCTIATD